jgi:EmrB/QacA subfamily drug resistance transporter
MGPAEDRPAGDRPGPSSGPASSGSEAGPYRWVVLGIVMMGTFMAILDASIVNVALPHMMSAFGVNRDQIEWVSTAFMLASAVAMPLVGWLAARMGHKRLYLISLGLFTAGSAACALAWSLDAMIVARVIQAVGGGAIQPVGMAIVSDLFAPHERGRALGIWGTGIMVGPALGPTLGGYLTDLFNWRVIFSVNLPFGVLTLLFGLAYMKRDKLDGIRRSFDFWGFSFLSLALIAGLLGLSNGQDEGWTSSYVSTCAALATVGLILFLAVESAVEHPLLDLGLFRIRNFSASMSLAIFRAVGLFGGVFLLPIFLENLVGYTTIQTGLWMMPGAVSVGVMMPIAGRLADRYPPRWLVIVGVIATGLSLLAYGYLDPRSGPFLVIVP